ncbi:MAG: zinc ribbon domain-containing protein [Candidatus Marinimicrobia bacterium]|jgi:hypothetical protein|nr:zinc ribbon domain-containing protein [Candidatus Neomarinimicrobiota bacterium]MBT3632880.1 zinc ribbon domain-containing protein [Candidatus Neomarinimicrobiota bacterium]MBT3681990.1 zinc ribbon domain-containing protein [Candidatus Neomarinimicrobiota bacterium]MBT3758981.1 zinc ribbon domain-containing protein [Candidatus Neomarinimicrobiota bacterium]MBT3895120.1 zinc ribbon domain-containing protein [Candidatus Neomarinimicrobiota bacterium]
MIAPIILFIVFVLMSYLIIKPFLAGAGNSATIIHDDTDEKVKELEKISLLKQIREVEFEKEMGVTSDEDFQRIKSELVQQVSGYLGKDKSAGNGSKHVVLGSEINCPDCNETVSKSDKFCGFCGTSLKNPGCPKCGETITPNAKFCSTCGTSTQ